MLLASLFGLTACPKVIWYSKPPPDIPVCIELVPDQDAQCFYTIQKKEFEVTGSAWQKLKAGSVILPAKTSWVPLKVWILDTCHRLGNCEDVVNKIKTLDLIYEVYQPQIPIQ